MPRRPSRAHTAPAPASRRGRGTRHRPAAWSARISRHSNLRSCMALSLPAPAPQQRQRAQRQQHDHRHQPHPVHASALTSSTGSAAGAGVARSPPGCRHSKGLRHRRRADVAKGERAARAHRPAARAPHPPLHLADAHRVLARPCPRTASSRLVLPPSRTSRCTGCPRTGRSTISAGRRSPRRSTRQMVAPMAARLGLTVSSEAAAAVRSRDDLARELDAARTLRLRRCR